MTREEYKALVKNFDFGWASPERMARVLAWGGTYPEEYKQAYDAWKAKQYDPKAQNGNQTAGSESLDSR